MKHFITLADLPDFKKTLADAIELKKDATKFDFIGKGKTLGMLFF